MEPATSSRKLPAFALAGLLHGLLLLALLPPEVLPIGPDESGYLKSPLETIQRHRPWTDDFLEPWAASLSALSAVVYQLTGRFSWSIHGCIAGLAALSFFTLCSVFSLRLARRRDIILCAALCLTFPPLLRRSAEYIDLILYLPCLFGCVWAAEKKRWSLFLPLWCIAIADRQSAALWAILPAWESWRAWKSGAASDGSLRPAGVPAAVVMAGAGWFLFVAMSMNVTLVQLTRTARMVHELSPGLLAKTLAASAVVCAVGVGLGSLVAGSRRSAWSPRARWIIGALALVLIVIDPRRLVATDTAYDFLYGSPGRLYASLVVAVAGLGWWLGPPRLRTEFVLWTAASIALIGLRQVLFDRYAFELVALGFFAAFLGWPASAPAAATRTVPPWLKPAAAAALVSFQLAFVFLTKASIDETRAWTLLHERALRAGGLRASELAAAPFPLRSWHLHAHATAHPAPGGRALAGYARFIEPTIEPWRRYPAMLARLRGVAPAARSPDAASVVAGGGFRVAWLWHAEFALVRRAAAAPVSPLGAAYRFVPIPVDDAGWRALLQGPLIE